MKNKQYNSLSRERFDELYNFGWRFYKQNGGSKNAKNRTYKLAKTINGNRSIINCISATSTMEYIINKSGGKIDMRTARAFSPAEEALIMKFCILNNNGTETSRIQKTIREIKYSLGVDRNMNSVKGKLRNMKIDLESKSKPVEVAKRPMKRKNPALAKPVTETMPKQLSEIELLDLIGKQDKKTLELLKTYIEFKLS